MKILLLFIILFFPAISHSDTVNTFGRSCHTSIPVNKLFCDKLKKRELALFNPINTKINDLNTYLNTSIGGNGPAAIDDIKVSGKVKTNQIGSTLRFRFNENYIFTLNLFYAN